MLKYLLTKYSFLESSICQLVLINRVRQRFSLRTVHKMGCSTSKMIKIQQTSEMKRKTSTMATEDDFVEGIVCQESDIKENEMKVFDLGDAGKVLLVRQNGKLSALGNKCTHYGAPLQNGALGDGRIRCQWHGACFNIATGDIEDFPGLDSLPCYQVKVENNNVKVRARRSELQANKRIKPMTKQDPSILKHYVVVGAGPSGAVCAETLRQEGFKGKITLIGKEKYLPYDRVKVDKAMDSDISILQFRKAEFYNEHNINVIIGCEVTELDTEHRVIKLENGTSINYDAVYLATGSSARKAAIPGADLKNVVVIRNYDDAVHILSLLKPNKHIVILGSSFIGMEAAAFCSNKVEKVTVVSKDSVPFQGSLGPEVGEGVMKLFKEKGVHFIAKSGLKRCIDNGSGEVGSVELADGKVIKADVCIMGIGSTLNTGFLKNSGVSVNENGSIEVNDLLQTNFANVFAGGDIANAPVWSRNSIKAAIGHYGLAEYHGRMAAKNMLNQKVPIKSVPFFWTMIFGKSIRYCGYGRYNNIIYSGTPQDLKFVAYYLDGDEVVAISACQMDPIVSKYAERLAQGKKLYKKDLEGDLLAWSTTSVS